MPFLFPKRTRMYTASAHGLVLSYHGMPPDYHNGCCEVIRTLIGYLLKTHIKPSGPPCFPSNLPILSFYCEFSILFPRFRLLLILLLALIPHRQATDQARRHRQSQSHTHTLSLSHAPTSACCVYITRIEASFSLSNSSNSLLLLTASCSLAIPTYILALSAL